MANIHEYSDEKLVALSRENIDYFSHLFERYKNKLLLYIKRVSSFNDAHAHEVLQETFIKIWKNINDFDETMKFSSWAYRITHNTTINTWKKEKKYFSNISGEELPIEHIDEKVSLMDTFQEKIDAMVLSKAIATLPVKYRDILVLHYWEDKTYEELSEILKKPKGTIGTLLFRAKKELKKQLKEDNYHG